MIGDPRDVILEVDNVFKKFSRSNGGQRRLLSAQLAPLLLGKAPRHEKLQQGDFWSLQDLNFSVRRGEVLGVIGMNGAGKSTLLRVLSGLAMPDVGEVRVYGSSGALIELGAGMKGQLSGRENVFIKGALLGKSRREMLALYDEIADFAELGEFMRAPVRTYSSGMRLRLGFSIAVHMRPDLLLLDEILSVGDYAFRQKCRGKINAMLKDAGVVFASHSMDDIRALCDRVLVLDHGKVAYEGPAKKAIALFQEMAEKPAGAVALPEKGAFYGELYYDHDRISDVSHGWTDEAGAPAGKLETWGPAQFRIKFKLARPPRRLVVGITVWTAQGNLVTGLATDTLDIDLFDHSKLQHELTLQLPKLSLNPGRYVSTVTIVDNGQALYRALNEPFETTTSKRHHGVATPMHAWSVQSSGAAADQQDNKADAEGVSH